MQSTGQTSMQASQPVQLSALTTANSLGSFLRALPAPFAMMTLESPTCQSDGFPSILASRTLKASTLLAPHPPLWAKDASPSLHAQLDGLAEQMRIALADRLDFLGEELVYLLRRTADELARIECNSKIYPGQQRVCFQAL